MAATDQKTGVDPKDVDRAIKQIKKVREAIKLLEKIGVDVPKELNRSLKVLEAALKTGKDLADACDEAKDALEKYNKKMLAACDKLEDLDEKAICEVEKTRRWQYDNLNFTININNPRSAISNFIRKTLQRLTPKEICKHWDYCSKNAE